MTPTDWLSLLNSGGVVALLVLIVFASIFWVKVIPKSIHDEILADRDKQITNLETKLERALQLNAEQSKLLTEVLLKVAHSRQES